MWIWDFNSLGDILRDLIFTKKTPLKQENNSTNHPHPRCPPQKYHSKKFGGFFLRCSSM